MTDLYDDARCVRDAAMAEIERLTGGADVCSPGRDANMLGVHLSAVTLAFLANRLNATEGPVANGGQHWVLACGIGLMIANVAMALRPIGPDGRPATPTAVAIALVELIAQHAMHHTQLNEQGLQDFVIPLRRSDTGALEVPAFDYTDLLKGKP
jgi:hypothetical protein